MEAKSLKRENEESQKKIQDLNEEQENLLCLLQEMEAKCKKYTKALKQFGYNDFEDDDDDDDPYDEEESDDLKTHNNNNLNEYSSN